jgi:sialidase-1
MTGPSRRRFAACALVAAAGRAHGAAPALEKRDLFRAGEGGYATYRIPGLATTSRGVLLAYCEARKDARGDWGDIDIVLRRSRDGGRTWSEPRTIADVKEPARNPAAAQQKLLRPGAEAAANNPVAIADGIRHQVHFLYCVDYARCFYMRSYDDGASFGPPREITSTFEAFRREYDWKVLATGPGHGIQLRSGRLLVPIWLSTGEGMHGHRPSCVSTIYSDDHGATWQRGEIAVNHGVAYATPRSSPNSARRLVNPGESVAVELTDGRVMMNIRSESPERRRAVVVGRDGAAGWSTPIFDPQLYEPICMAAIVRVTAQPAARRNRILFANPDSRHVPKQKDNWRGSRENMSVKLSYDEGKSWSVSKVLDPGIAGYPDLALGPDGSLFCLYERGGVAGEQMTTASLTLARFNLAWLTDGRDPGDLH